MLQVSFCHLKAPPICTANLKTRDRREMSKAGTSEDANSSLKFPLAAINVAQKALEPSASTTGNALADLIGGFISDPIREWRTRRLIKCLEQTKAEFDKRGIPLENAKSLPNGAALQLFQDASLCDDDHILTLWSKLLANSIDGQHDLTHVRAFCDILNSIGPGEAQLLQLLWHIQKKFSHEHLDLFHEYSLPKHRRHPDFDAKKFESYVSETVALALSGWRKFPESSQEISIQNLLRLRLISLRLDAPYEGDDPSEQVGSNVGTFLNAGAIVGTAGYTKATLLPYILGQMSSDKYAARDRFESSVRGIVIGEDRLALTSLGNSLMAHLE